MQVGILHLALILLQIDLHVFCVSLTGECGAASTAIGPVQSVGLAAQQVQVHAPVLPSHTSTGVATGITAAPGGLHITPTMLMEVVTPLLAQCTKANNDLQLQLQSNQHKFEAEQRKLIHECMVGIVQTFRESQLDFFRQMSHLLKEVTSGGASSMQFCPTPGLHLSQLAPLQPAGPLQTLLHEAEMTTTSSDCLPDAFIAMQ